MIGCFKYIIFPGPDSKESTKMSYYKLSKHKLSIKNLWTCMEKVKTVV